MKAPEKHQSQKHFLQSFIHKSRCEFEPLLGIHTARKNWVAHKDLFPPCHHAMRPCKSMGDHLFRGDRISNVIHLMRRANSSEKSLMLAKTESQRRRGRQRMRWLNSITDSRDMTLGKLWGVVRDRMACCAAVHGVTKSQTRLSDSTTTGYLKGLTCFAQVKRSKREFASSVVQYVLFIDGKHIFQT